MPSLLFQSSNLSRRLPFRFVNLSSFSSYSLSISYSHVSPSSPGISHFLSLLQSFHESPPRVKSIHAQIITNSCSDDQFLAAKLVLAYLNLGCLDDARRLFDQIPQPDTVLCNRMISWYLRNERYREVVALFQMMRTCNIEVNSHTCNFILKACTGLSNYHMGLGVIKVAIEKGMANDRFFGSSMLNFLVKFGDIDEARSLFDMMPERDVVCWNSMIGGHVQAWQFVEAFNLFFDMFRWGIWPTSVTMASVIQACWGIGNSRLGKCVHGWVLVLGMGSDIMVLTSLINMYGKLGDVRSAGQIFNSMPTRNLVSWNAMICGYIQNGLVHESFGLFRMLLMGDSRYDAGTMVSLLQGCSQTADLRKGTILHGCILRKGIELSLILSTAIVDMYSKCGALKQANFIFENMKNKNVITWTAMLVGLSQNGHAEEALNLFHCMQKEGIAANSVTLTTLVHSCAHLGSLKKGKSVHACLIRHGLASDVVQTTALIDMYAKCGKINSAELVFYNGSVSKDIILWNSMLMGYGMHGLGYQAVGLYKRMVAEGLEPNQATFVSLLTACSHSGLVDEGINLFYSMEREHKMKPSDKHYACLVDVLSRAGRLEEAEAVINQMPFQPSSNVFEALLSGCRTYKNINIGIQVADRLLQVDALNPGVYILLSNIYAGVKKWDAVDYVRHLMRKQGLKKAPGYSFIEVGNKIHSFLAGDDSHQNSPEIFNLLENLRSEVEAAGYVPDTSCVLRDVDEPMKIKLLWGHSERLAIAFGLLSTTAGSLIRITKNLRVCVDCHTVTKYITKIVKREIIVRDANRFHHFVEGKCSCNDYW